MNKIVAAGILTLSLAGCVATRDQLVNDFPDAPKHRKLIATVFYQNLGRHFILGDLPWRHPRVSGPYVSTGVAGGTIYQYCASAVYEQQPFKNIKAGYVKAVVTQNGATTSVNMITTNAIHCQGEGRPFVELAEIIASNTGVSVEAVLNGEKKPQP